MNKDNVVIRKMKIGLIIIYSLAHWLLCFISGQWWDDWNYWINGAESIKTAYLESGIPQQAYNILSVMWIPNWGYRVVVFFVFLAVGLLFFSILTSVDFFSKEDAFWISAVAMTVVVNDARALLNCYGYTLALLLFMIAFYIITRIRAYRGSRQIWMLRVFSWVLLLYSYTTESLLVFTGVIWLYLFYYIWNDNKEKQIISKIIIFIKKYSDYLGLPFLFFCTKRLFFKPYGAYVGYNSINLESLVDGILVLPFAAFKTGENLIHSYLLQASCVPMIVFLIVVLVYMMYAKKTENSMKQEKIRILATFILGCVVYCAGIFPYIVIRGEALKTIGPDGRDVMMAGFGVGIIVVAFCRIFPLKKYIQNFIPILFIVLGIFHFNEWYLNYQEDWYHQKIFANGLADKGELGDDDVILCDFSFNSPNISTRFYSLNGMSYLATGKMDKFFLNGINDLRYGIVFNENFQKGYNADDFDISDMTIDAVMFINNIPISNSKCLEMRFDEILRKDIFERKIGNLTDVQYVRIDKAGSDSIYDLYKNSELTSEGLKNIVLTAK